MSETLLQGFKDSGDRRDFGTGAVRDMAKGKGRFDLLPYDALHQLALVFELGAEKYAEENWTLGIPVSVFIDSAMRHLSKAAAGHVDEPHLCQAMWNITCAIQMAIWAADGKRDAALTYRHAVRLCDRTLNAASEIPIDKKAVGSIIGGQRNPQHAQDQD